MDPKLIEQYGASGLVIVGLFLIVRQIVTWMQGRIDSRDAQLDERHAQLVELTRQTVAFVEDAKRVNEAMIAEIRNMGSGICERLDRIEGLKRVGAANRLDAAGRLDAASQAASEG